MLPITVKNIILNNNYYIFENEKIGRKFIKKISPNKAQNEIKINLINKFTEKENLTSYLNPIFEGHNICLISDAGCPGIADPGAEIVEMAHRLNIDVDPIVGPSSIILAMMSSGLNGQNFAFNGYLPIERDEKKKSIKKLEKYSQTNNQSQIFIETPYRNQKMFDDLIKILSKETKLSIAINLTMDSQYIKTKSVSKWQKEKIKINKSPAIFIIKRD